MDCLHLAGYDHETDNGEMRKKEDRLREQLNLPSRTYRTCTWARHRCGPAQDGRESFATRAPTMNLPLAILLLVLLGLLALVSYVDRLYAEMGKFLSREFQENIEAYEERVEPRLHVSRDRAAMSMTVLAQLSMASIGVLIGYVLFKENRWVGSGPGAGRGQPDLHHRHLSSVAPVPVLRAHQR